MAKLNLNTYPYYDDFDLDKNFHKVLFKPGYAVQARELTQLQTILQDQIKRFGDNIFKEGSVISGCPESTNFDVDVVKIKDLDSSSATISDAALNALVGKVLVGATDNVRALVKKVKTGRDDLGQLAFKGLFLQYLSQGDSGTTSTFAAGETLTQEDDTDITVVVADSGASPITKGSLFTVGDGVVYANGNFIRHYTQTIILEPFSSSPTKKVGFLVNETIVDSEDDETLLDPAQGAFNYTAQGADRFKLSTTLAAYGVNELVENFSILYEVQSGEISRRYDRTQYAELNRTLARRTYDESGDYVIVPFKYHIREHLVNGENGGVYTSGQGGDAGKLAVGIEPGKAYVRGYEYELNATKYLDVDKPTDSLSTTGLRVSTAYGNYLIVDEVAGPPPMDGSVVSLRSAAAGAVTANTFSGTSAPGSEIGTARIANLEYISGTSGAAACKYRLYLYDIEMVAGSIGDVRGVYYNGSPDFHADVQGTDYELKETGFAPLIFPTSYDYVKSFKILPTDPVDNSFIYRKVFTGQTITIDGEVRVSLSAGNEKFAFTSAMDATINSEIVVIAETDVNAGGSKVYDAGKIFDLTATNNGVTTLTAQNLTVDIHGPGGVDVGATATIIVSVAVEDIVPRTKTLREDRFVRLQTSAKLGLLHKVISTSDVSVANDTITWTTHGFTTTNYLVYYAAEGTALGGLTDGTTYYVIVVDSNTIKLATSSANATAGTAINLTGTGNSYQFFTQGNYMDASDSGSNLIWAFPTAAAATTWSSSQVTSEECPVDNIVYNGTTNLGTVASFSTDNSGPGTTIRYIVTCDTTIPGTPTATGTNFFTVAHPSWDLATKSFPKGSEPSLGLYDLFKVDYIKAGASTSNWAAINTSGTDRTNNFTVTNGQEDDNYNLGVIRGTFAEYRRYVVRVDHFEHNAGVYFCVDSYPLPTQGVNPASGQIYWYEIPTYEAQNGVLYDLRNNIDFRFTVAATAVTTTILTSSTINPSGYTNSNKSFTGFTPTYFPHPEEEFTTPISWNIPRIDRVVLDTEGVFKSVTGTAATAPEIPLQPANSMDLGILTLPPYPAMSPKAAGQIGRKAYKAGFSASDQQRRYTMADIGEIDTRLTNLEKYTKLSFLEQKTINALLYNDSGNERFKNGILVDSFERGTKLDYTNGTNRCTVGNGVLTAKIDSDPLELEFSSSSNIYRAPADAQIVIRQPVAEAKFIKGETITQATSAATGKLEHAVQIAKNSSYKWIRLYLTGVTGTFAETSYTVSGGTSSSSGVITYAGLSTATLATTLRPDLISTISNGTIATLPYTHSVYTENPYASEAVKVTETVIYGYEGEIILSPSEDIWFDHRDLPEPPVIVAAKVDRDDSKPLNTPILKQMDKAEIAQRDIVKKVVNRVFLPKTPPIKIAKAVPVEPEIIVSKAVKIDRSTTPVSSPRLPVVKQSIALPAIVSSTPVVPVEAVKPVLPVDSPAPVVETPKTSPKTGSGGTSLGSESHMSTTGTSWTYNQQSDDLI